MSSTFNLMAASISSGVSKAVLTVVVLAAKHTLLRRFLTGGCTGLLGSEIVLFVGDDDKTEVSCSKAVKEASPLRC